jgi:hypothetical protein
MIPVKKVIIASFQRSGTHFLINNLATNFTEVEDGWVDLLNRELRNSLSAADRLDFRKTIWDQLHAYHQTPMRRCVKTHFQIYFLERWLDAILEKYDVLYVVRDPRDTLVACFNYYNQTNFEHFIKEPVFSKFLRADLRAVKTETSPFSYSHVKPRNIVDKWNNHVLGWLPYRDKGVVFVKFSDLKFRWRETLEAIASKTSQQLKPAIQPVLVTDQRVRPDFKLAGLRRGEAGIWRDYFSAADLQFVDQTLSEQTKQFYDEQRKGVS